MDVEWRRGGHWQNRHPPPQTAGMGGVLFWRLRYVGKWYGSVGRRSEEAGRRETRQKGRG